MLPSWTVSVQTTAVHFLAAAPTDPTTGWIAYGPLGLMVAGFATGVIVPGHVYRTALKEIERLNKTVDELYTKTLPLVEANTRATEQAIKALSGSRQSS